MRYQQQREGPRHRRRHTTRPTTVQLAMAIATFNAEGVCALLESATPSQRQNSTCSLKRSSIACQPCCWASAECMSSASKTSATRALHPLRRRRRSPPLIIQQAVDALALLNRREPFKVEADGPVSRLHPTTEAAAHGERRLRVRAVPVVGGRVPCHDVVRRRPHRPDPRQGRAYCHFNRDTHICYSLPLAPA